MEKNINENWQSNNKIQEITSKLAISKNKLQSLKGDTQKVISEQGSSRDKLDLFKNESKVLRDKLYVTTEKSLLLRDELLQEKNRIHVAKKDICMHKNKSSSIGDKVDEIKREIQAIKWNY